MKTSTLLLAALLLALSEFSIADSWISSKEMEAANKGMLAGNIRPSVAYTTHYPRTMAAISANEIRSLEKLNAFKK